MSGHSGEGFVGRLRRWLRQSPRIHVRESQVPDLKNVVALIDRFIDGRLNYPLEWDDFVSWSHSNPNIEKLRNSIAELEHLFLSKNPSQRKKALESLLALRNGAAAMVGVVAREMNHQTT